MMSRTGRTRLVVIATLMMIGFAFIGVASAYMVAAGGGTGSAGTGTTLPVTLTPAVPTSQVFPGGQSAVALNINNPNPGPVRIESLALDTSQGTGGFAVDGAHSGCSVAALSFATQTNGGAGWTAPGDASLSVTLPDALVLDLAAGNACQGASFTIYLMASQ